jgi:hypothetical protein
LSGKDNEKFTGLKPDILQNKRIEGSGIPGSHRCGSLPRLAIAPNFASRSE